MRPGQVGQPIEQGPVCRTWCRSYVLRMQFNRLRAARVRVHEQELDLAERGESVRAEHEELLLAGGRALPEQLTEWTGLARDHRSHSALDGLRSEYYPLGQSGHPQR